MLDASTKNEDVADGSSSEIKVDHLNFRHISLKTKQELKETEPKIWGVTCRFY